MDILQAPNTRNIAFTVALFLCLKVFRFKAVNDEERKEKKWEKVMLRTFSVQTRICSTCLRSLNRKSVIACNLSANDRTFGGAGGDG